MEGIGEAVNNYFPTPVLKGDCGCLCKPPVADSFYPGTTAAVDVESGGIGDSNYREVRAKGLPPILRMGTLAGFLGAMGDDTLDLIDSGSVGSFVDAPPVFVPQIENNSGFLTPFQGISPSVLNFESAPEGSLQFSSPTNVAQIPSNIAPATSQPGTSVASTAISAASQLLKARTGGPTLTMSPAQIAAMQKAQQANLGMSQILPGVTNQNLFLYGGAALLVLALTMGRK